MWKAKVNEIMVKATLRLDGKPASERTQTLTKEVVFASIRLLHELGYKVQDPLNIGERHVRILVENWWHVKRKKIKTIQNELSRLRVFFAMAGKPGLVGDVERYLPDVDPGLLIVHATAKASKSWAANGIDIVQKIQEVDERDWRLGLMLRLEVGFGLRREEVIKCDPHAQDYGHYLQVLPGQGKGGRWRNIPILSSAQREILNFVKARTPKNKPLGWENLENGKTASLAQNISRYENLMAALGFTKANAGVTGHGLRAQFAENHTLLLGLIPPTLEGQGGQVSVEELNSKKGKISQALGHNRTSILAAYVGAFAPGTTASQVNESLTRIRNGLQQIKGTPNHLIAIEWMRDCFQIEDVVAALGVQITPQQAHALWSMHSRRHGVSWMKPEREICVALEVEILAWRH